MTFCFFWTAAMPEQLTPTKERESQSSSQPVLTTQEQTASGRIPSHMLSLLSLQSWQKNLVSQLGNFTAIFSAEFKPGCRRTAQNDIQRLFIWFLPIIPDISKAFNFRNSQRNLGTKGLHFQVRTYPTLPLFRRKTCPTV